ncbi:MAG: HAD family hydrolase [Treponema sp.]|nr:HAD family hydrolase [Treponema sp.]
MLENISVIAFDIDGTLYPSWALNVRIVVYFLRNLRFFLSFNKVRKQLHKTAPVADFYEYQARLLAIELDCSVQNAKSMIQQIVYDGLKPVFERIKPFKYVRDAFQRLKDSGYRLAILSDFPPSQKGEMWGLLPYCDAVLGAEEIGALKPSKYPFGILARVLNVAETEILYVGNSVRYDVIGARNAGLKSAYLLPWWRKFLHLKHPNADISFSNYRQFAKIVIQ